MHRALSYLRMFYPNVDVLFACGATWLMNRLNFAAINFSEKCVCLCMTLKAAKCLVVQLVTRINGLTRVQLNSLWSMD